MSCRHRAYIERNVGPKAPYDWSEKSFEPCGVFFPIVIHQKLMVTSYPIIYNLSLNEYRDFMKDHKAGKEVAEIVRLYSTALCNCTVNSL